LQPIKLALDTLARQTLLAKLAYLWVRTSAEPGRPARQLIPPRWMTLLQAARKNAKPNNSLTIGEFYHALAKLGGFIGRKSDGEPGWMTIWRGWQKLFLMVRGTELVDTIR
jgi:Transposase Tn5 dimerisation domain